MIKTQIIFHLIKFFPMAADRETKVRDSDFAHCTNTHKTKTALVEI